MSTVANSSLERSDDSGSVQSSKPGSAIQLVEERLREVQNALWTSDFIRGSLLTALFFVVGWLVWIVADHWFIQATPSIRAVGLLTLLVGVVGIITRRLWPLATGRIDPNYAAHAIEADNPGLRQSLTTFLTLRAHANERTLQGSVVRGLANQTAAELQRHDQLPTEATGLLRGWLIALLAVLSLIVYWGLSPKSSWQSTKRLFVPWLNIEAPTRVRIADVRPGNATVLAGREVPFAATILGLRDSEVAIVSARLNSGQTIDVAMRPDDASGNSDRYSGSLPLDPATSGSVAYSIVAGDAISRDYRLTIQDVPIVQLESVTIQPPAYTQLAQRVQSNGSVSAPQDSQVSIVIRGNRALKRAVLEFNPRQSGDNFVASAGAVEMPPVALSSQTEPKRFSKTFSLRLPNKKSGVVRLDSYRIKVWDKDDQSNPSPIIFPIEIIEDLPPDVAIVVPQQTPKELPITAQQAIEVHAIDPDFGLNQISLVVQRNRREASSPLLWSAGNETVSTAESINRVLAGERGNQIGDFAIRPDQMGLKPGDLIRVFAIARDNRSSESDQSIRPNERRSDPIELRITAASDAPIDENDGVESADEDDGFGDLPRPGQPDEPPSPESNGSADTGEQGATSQDQGGAGNGGGASQTDSSGENDAQQDPQPGGENSSEEGGSDSNSMQQNGPPSGSGTGDSETSETEGGTDSTDGDTESSSDANGASGDRGSPQETTGDESDEQAPPSHDGEAFERIEDYLNEKDKPDQPTGEASNNNQTAGQGESPSDQNSQDSNPQTDSGSQNDSTRDKSQQGDRSETGDQTDSNQPSQSPGTAPEQSEATDPNDPASGSSSNQTGDDAADDASTQRGSTEKNAATDNAMRDDPSVSDSQESETDDASDRPPQGSSNTSERPATSDGNGMNEESTASESTNDPSTKNTSDGNPNESGRSGETQSDGGAAQENSENNKTENDPASPGQGNSASSDAKPGSNDSESAEGSSVSESANPDTQPTDNVAGGGNDPTSVPNGLDETGAPRAPDPVDVDYAKKATDLVLDYLDKTRESPDQELLDRLNWDKQDLDRFRDRWQRLRELDRPNDPAGQPKNEFEEALRSLGLRPSESEAMRSKSGGGVPGRMNDSGARSKPPPAFRDSFESFRRNAGRLRSEPASQ